MEQKILDVYSETSNYGIVKMPGRSFPGCVIQGDSLAILCSHARSIHQRAIQLVGKDDLVDEASELLDLLQDRLGHYEQVLANHNLTLPYSKHP
jgi:hypothetical protein